ncbi:carbamoyltransferase [Thermodesulfobacteriota bacterium]
MYTLGINPGHDATACIIDEKGRILASVAEERMSRVKFDYGIPYLAMEECLRLVNLTRADIGLIGVGFRKYLHPETHRWNTLHLSNEPAPFDYDDFRLAYASRWDAVAGALKKNILDLFPGKSGKVYSQEELHQYTLDVLKDVFLKAGFGKAEVFTIDHHLAHAASAYYSSGFENPLIVTCDGAGDGLCASMNAVVDGRVQRLHGAPDSCSPGQVYSEVTHLLGFKRNRHEGKITGLAAYGDEKKAGDQFLRYMNLDNGGTSFSYDPDLSETGVRRKIRTLAKLLQGQRIMGDHISDVRKHLETELDGVSREDLSAAVQKALEENVAQYVNHEFVMGRWDRIALAGGVFANVKLNQRIAELEGVKEVFVHPNMGDGGVSYGAALLAVLEKDSRAEIAPRPLNDVYFGSGYTDDEIKKCLDRAGIEATHFRNVEKEIAARVARKKIVGRFDGKMEYGPRALGNRSILADPTDMSINDWLNKRLKRTEFMPFAPSVLERAAPEIFKNYESGAYTSSFMTITFDVFDEWIERAPAVVHVDGTARPQVVKREHNESYYRVLEEYEKLTGLPLFVNTSFNMHEEPILRTPDDALRSFEAGSVDVLAIGSFIVE